MKHCLLILTAAVILIGCKPKSQSNNVSTMPDSANTKNNDQAKPINSRNWSTIKLEACERLLRKYADKHNIPKSEIDNFISCAINALASWKPDGQIEFESAEAQAILKNCENGQTNNNSNNSQTQTDTPGTPKWWSNAFREKMKRGLSDYAMEQGIQGSQVNDFTSCVISTLEAKYPDEKNVPDDNSEAIAVYKDCQNKLSKN